METNTCQNFFILYCFMVISALLILLYVYIFPQDRERERNFKYFFYEEIFLCNID